MECADLESKAIMLAMCGMVVLGTWTAATCLLAFGLWMLVVGDRESNLYLLAPLVSLPLAVIVGAWFMRLRGMNAARRFAYFAGGIVTAFVVGWGVIVLLDEGL
jgi:hypothetical protein